MREPFIDYMKADLRPDTVLIACGLPASYKTETTQMIAELKGYHIVRTDLIRLELLKDEDIFDEKIASDMKKRELVYDKMFACADELAEKGEGVILDATFITQELRRRAAQIAAKHKRIFVIQQTQCPQEVSLRRISQRTRENYESNALTEKAYLNNKKKFQPVDLDDLIGLYPALTVTHFLVDTTSDVAEEWAVIGKTIRYPFQ